MWFFKTEGKIQIKINKYKKNKYKYTKYIQEVKIKIKIKNRKIRPSYAQVKVTCQSGFHTNDGSTLRNPPKNRI
jgi:hypothetical protein